MKVLVTGSAGFIGRYLVRRLRQIGHEVTGIDARRGSPTTDYPALRELCRAVRPEVIAHLGAQCSTTRSLADPVRDFELNALGTVAVAEAARDVDARVIYTSTVKVQHGSDGKITPLGRSKLTGEEYLRMYSDLWQVPSVILRPSTIYGPGQDADEEAGWFTWFIRAAQQGLPVVVRGDGSQSRDVLAVSDFVNLMVSIVENSDAYLQNPVTCITYSVGGGRGNEVSIRELISELSRRWPMQVSYGPALPGDLGRVVNENRITGVAGWFPMIGWRDGLDQTAAWLLSGKDPGDLG